MRWMSIIEILVVAALGVGVAACSHVHPWERGVLAKPCMMVSPDPEEAQIEQHLLAYREGSAGGYGDSGGGCGCN